MKRIAAFLSLSLISIACNSMSPENPDLENSPTEVHITGYINWRGVILNMPAGWEAVSYSFDQLILENEKGYQVQFTEDCSFYDAGLTGSKFQIGEFTYQTFYKDYFLGKNLYPLGTDDDWTQQLIHGSQFQDESGCPLGIKVDNRIDPKDFEALLLTRLPDLINWYEFQITPPHKMDWVIEGGFAGMGPLYFVPADKSGLINGYNAGCMIDTEAGQESVIRMDFWTGSPPPPQEIKPGYAQTESSISLNGQEIQVTEIKPDDTMGVVPYDEASHQVLYYLQISETRWLRIFTTKPYQVQTEALLEQITNQIP